MNIKKHTKQTQHLLALVLHTLHMPGTEGEKRVVLSRQRRPKKSGIKLLFKIFPLFLRLLGIKTLANFDNKNYSLAKIKIVKLMFILGIWLGPNVFLWGPIPCLPNGNLMHSLHSRPCTHPSQHTFLVKVTNAIQQKNIP